MPFDLEAGTALDDEGKHHASVYGVQAEELHFDEEQKDGDTTSRAEKILQVVPSPHPAQRDEVKFRFRFRASRFTLKMVGP